MEHKQQSARPFGSTHPKQPVDNHQCGIHQQSAMIEVNDQTYNATYLEAIGIRDVASVQYQVDRTGLRFLNHMEQIDIADIRHIHIAKHHHGEVSSSSTRPTSRRVSISIRSSVRSTMHAR
jgi:hypothetical protein